MSTIKDINYRISNEFCQETYDKLLDQNLIFKFKTSNSFLRKKNLLEDIVRRHIDDEKIRNQLVSDLIGNINNDDPLGLISPGSKGAIRGVRFNEIIRDYINNLDLDREKFTVCFEKSCETLPTDEIPDWFILDKSTGKTIIGMNQIALWGGGQQGNRGSKYIFGMNNTEKNKFLCVVCNKTQLKYKNKVYKLFEAGFRNDTLCYIGNLKNIIYSHFNLH